MSSTGALLTIISGTPGAGKTALAVSTVLDFLKANPSRPVFSAGVADLTLPHLAIPPVKDWTIITPHPDDPSIDYPVFTFPDGSLILIDEAQNFFPSRSSGSKVPMHVRAMERHRHTGLDFVLITQGPGMLDPNIRRLCGRFIHIRDTWQGRFLYEWPEVVDPESKANRNSAVTRRFSLPKRVFGMYKSSSMHVKRERRVPGVFWLFLLALGVTAVLGWRVYEKVGGAIAGETSPANAPETPTTADRVMSGTYRGAVASTLDLVPVGGKVDDYVPRLPQRPETAPIYDGIREVRSMPTVAGCVAFASKCKCYTGQGTDAFLSDAQCRAWLASPPFDPWRMPSTDYAAQPAPIQTPAAAPTPQAPHNPA